MSDIARQHYAGVPSSTSMPTAADDRPPARARRRATRADAPPASHLERSSEWQGVRAGDPVEVTGVRARSTVWSFLAHVRNLRSGEEWVEVVGGREGSRAVRSFRPEQIFAPSPRASGRSSRSASATRAPLSDAPRLPL
ncbi:MAG TPA: hypothetical protein VMD28_07140 [Acidimicrobiales bacterium]|nr:hypothetical protein [Acidimicrobiales bacterium]